MKIFLKIFVGISLSLALNSSFLLAEAEAPDSNTVFTETAPQKKDAATNTLSAEDELARILSDTALPEKSIHQVLRWFKETVGDFAGWNILVGYKENPTVILAFPFLPNREIWQFDYITRDKQSGKLVRYPALFEAAMDNSGIIFEWGGGDKKMIALIPDDLDPAQLNGAQFMGAGVQLSYFAAGAGGGICPGINIPGSLHYLFINPGIFLRSPPCIAAGLTLPKFKFRMKLKDNEPWGHSYFAGNLTSLVPPAALLFLGYLTIRKLYPGAKN